MGTRIVEGTLSGETLEQSTEMSSSHLIMMVKMIKIMMVTIMIIMMVNIMMIKMIKIMMVKMVKMVAKKEMKSHRASLSL